MNILEVEGLCKAYPAFALRDVSFAVEPGTIMGFIGRNGAGKSTTIKSMLNLVHPDSGRVTMFGQDFYANEPACKQQLGVVFGRMTRPVTLVLELDDTPLSTELQGFIGEMVALSNGKLNSVAVDAAGVITAEDGSSAPTSLTVGEPLAVTLPDGAELPVYGSLDDSGRAQFDVSGVLPSARPVVRMCVPAENSDAGTLLFTGLAFHGVPSGHEFNSFVLGLYNAAGPGQPLDDDLKARAEAIDTPIDVMILVSLTCTMCPETVLAAQRIASLNPNVRAEAYDVAHFPELKDQYGAMSVPCIVINHPGGEQKVEFGKKSVPQMLTLLGA